MQPVIRVDDKFSWNLERQASIPANISRQDAHVIAMTIQIAPEFADTDRTDDVGRRKRKGDDQYLHHKFVVVRGKEPAAHLPPILLVGGAPKTKKMNAVRIRLAVASRRAPCLFLNIMLHNADG